MKFLSAGRVVSERKTASGNCGSMISRDFGWLQGLLVIVENQCGDAKVMRWTLSKKLWYKRVEVLERIFQLLGIAIACNPVSTDHRLEAASAFAPQRRLSNDVPRRE
jgi:hypothetical protein